LSYALIYKPLDPAHAVAKAVPRSHGRAARFAAGNGGTGATCSSGTTTVVEFYNAAQDHYFITSATQEIAALDGGVLSGWQRTGLSFNAYDAGSGSASPVCRFYIPPALGDSHFYSASPSECEQTQVRFPGFTLESANVFRIGLPDAASGACASNVIPVYRLWNGRADTNHRYTMSLDTRTDMIGRGWIAEGYGPLGVAMCVW